MPDNFQQNGLIVTSNELIHAKYHFSLWQKRVFMYFVSMIEKEAIDFGLQKVMVADLIRFFEAEQNGTVSDIIEKVPKQLYETSIQVPYRDPAGHERFGEIRLVTKYTKPQDKKPGNAYIELKFNEDLRPHLLDLKKHFSKYELRYIVHLQSAHAIRIYEILKSHQFQRQIDLDVDYLKTILEVDTKYKLYGDFKRKIIDKSQQDLLTHCDIAFTYQEIKSGKKVVTLRFFIQENQPGGRRNPAGQGGAASKKASSPDLTAATNAEHDALFLELQAVAVGEWGVSPTRLVELIQQHEPERIRQAFRVTSRRAQAGVVLNRAGFFIEAIAKNYTDEQEQTAKKKTQQAEKRSAQAAEQKKHVVVLENQLADLVDKMRGEINSVIRKLVEQDPKTRAQAVEAVAQTRNPVLKKELESLERAADEQDFRENPKLREAVIWEIVRQNHLEFEAISQKFRPAVKAVLANLSQLSETGKLRFEIKTFLELV